MTPLTVPRIEVDNRRHRTDHPLIGASAVEIRARPLDRTRPSRRFRWSEKLHRLLGAICVQDDGRIHRFAIVSGGFIREPEAEPFVNLEEAVRVIIGCTANHTCLNSRILIRVP